MCSALERAEATAGVGAGELRTAFEPMLSHPPALALSGKVARGTRERLQVILARQGW
jgi:hypothetical protein